jgi:glutamate---methylamine ligase
VNSYRRINAPVTNSGATWSPNVISYAGNNRTHMIRIPAAGRFELRLPDGAANPYLMAAAIAEAGQDGIAQRRDPGRPLDTNVYRDPQSSDQVRHLPDNLLDALRALEQNSVLREGLGSSFTDSFLKLKRAQWRDYTRFVSPWEVEHTLDC